MSPPNVPMTADPSRSPRWTAGIRERPAVSGRLIMLALLGSPIAWTLHLLGSYLIVTLWCAGGWSGIGIALGVITIICGTAAILAGALAFRNWRRGQERLLTDREPGGPGSWDARMGERGARVVFLSVASVFLAAVFAYLIVLQGLPPMFTPICPATTMP